MDIYTKTVRDDIMNRNPAALPVIPIADWQDAINRLAGVPAAPFFNHAGTPPIGTVKVIEANAGRLTFEITKPGADDGR